MRDHTGSLQILQYNVQRSTNKVLTPFLQEECVKQADIICIQEPMPDQNHFRLYNPSTSQFHLIHGTGHVRTCIYVNKRLDINTWRKEIAESDICSIRIKVTTGEEQEEVIIHNVYNPSPISYTATASPSTIPQLREALQSEGHHIAIGDFNLHHPYWTGGRCWTRHMQADYLVQTATEAHMDLLLPVGTPTRITRDQSTTIDLVFGQKWISDRLLKCVVREDIHHDSDHRPVFTEIDLRPAYTPQIKRRQWKKLDPVKLNETLAKTLPKQKVLKTHEEIDRYVDETQQAIQQAADQAAPIARPSPFAEEWWTPQCREAVNETRRCRSSFEAYGTDDNWRRYLKAADRKGKIIKKAKRACFRAAMHKASSDPKGLWKLAKWAKDRSQKPKDLPQFPPLKRTQNATDPLASSFEEKTEVLRDKFFPPPPYADLSDIPGTVYPEELESDDTVSEAEIKAAIMNTKPDKAPGVSGIPNRVLQAGLEELIPVLYCLFNACVQLAYHPRMYKKANTIVLKKPGKGDYSEAGAYRPIALLEAIGKTLEKIIAKRLSTLAEANHLLPSTQMGARKQRSTETALELLVEQIHAVWGSGSEYVASVLSLDVSGAFDKVSHERLLHNLRKRRVPIYIINWVESFLIDRETSLSFDGKTSETQAAQTGIPQGSPISPILFLFFNADLVECCESLQLNTTSLGFVDDVNILTYGRTTEQNCRHLETAHIACADWAKKHGAAFAPQKYELIHFTRSPRKFNMAATVDIEGLNIKAKTEIKVLGVLLDTKLKWGAHLKKVDGKAANAMLAMTRLGASTWGATFARARQIYTTVIRPNLTYASPVWHKRNAQETLPTKEKNLQIIQNVALRNITGAFKRVSTETLEAETYTPPINIFMNRLQDRSTLRMQNTGRADEIRSAREKIRVRLHNVPPTAGFLKTPGEQKAIRLRNVLDKTQEYHEKKRQERRYRGTAEVKTPTKETVISMYHFEQWEKKWELYRRRIPDAHATEAQRTALGRKTLRMREGLQKAESTLAMHIRTERIGLQSYLYTRNVPGVESPECSCGWTRQTAKHVLRYCPRWTELQGRMGTECDTTNYRTMIATAKGLRAAARMLIGTGLLEQFSLARQLLYGEGGEEV